MDESNDVSQTIGVLSQSVNKLEGSLNALIAAAFSEKTRSLPPLERAKLYTHIVYALESILFCMCLPDC
jgi:hypothetical protein